MQERIWTISNFLSILRVIITLPVCFLLLSEDPTSRAWAVGLIVIAALTDYFDGRIARGFHQVTEFGKIVDPIADKIGIGAVGLVLALQGKIAWWFLVAVLLRDIAILAGGLFIRKRQGVTLQSNWIGKWTVTVLAAYVLMIVVDVESLDWLNSILLAASTVMLVVSFAVYLQRFVMVVKTPSSREVIVSPMSEQSKI